MRNTSSLLARGVAVAGLAAMTAGCSDLTRPGEILIIAEPPSEPRAAQVAPKADVAPRPGAMKLDAANEGEKAPQARPAVQPQKKAGGASCGG